MRRAVPDPAGHRTWVGPRSLQRRDRPGLAVALAALGTLTLGGPLSCTETHLFPVKAFESPHDASVPETSSPDADASSPADRVTPMDMQVPCPAIPQAPIGFAVPTTGGLLPQVPVSMVTATDETELAIFASSPTPVVIQIGSRITLTKPIEVASNKTLIGVNGTAELTGSGLMIKEVQNVIVQQLRISKAMGSDTDAITIQNAQNVWIDHCDLSSVLGAPEGTYDGLVDIVHASEWVELSWTVLHDHNRVGLVGHSASNAAEDTTHLQVTYHHNWIHDVSSNTPRIRFGTVHLFNNLYEHVAMNAIASVMSARTLIEGNYFVDVTDSIRTTYLDPDPGAVNLGDNIFDTASVPDLTQLALTTWRPTYATPVVLTPTADVPDLVRRCAGPQF